MSGRAASFTEPEEFKSMGDLGEPVAESDLLLQLSGKALGQFNHPGATGANQVVMVVFSASSGQFEAGGAIPKIDANHHVHLFQGF
jgi:hypothetical protein